MSDNGYSAEVRGNSSVAKKEYDSGTEIEVKLSKGFVRVSRNGERLAWLHVVGLEEDEDEILKSVNVEDGVLKNF